MRRRRTVCLVVAAFWALLIGCGAGPALASETDVASATLRQAAPGTIFRVWPLDGGVRPGFKGYRILYRSTDLNGGPVAVTGAILFPAEPGPSPRDVVAWAHPTTGVVSKCAPTLLPDLAGTIQGIDEMTDHGMVIVATDYIGLGTRDHHPYLIGRAAGQAVLDIVRAARQLKDVHASHRFAVWGHSQGGHAALYTAQLAKSYAPELTLVGVAAAAPATDLAALFEADRDTSSGRSLTAMTVLSWSKVFGLPLADLVEPSSLERFDALAGDCIETLSDFAKEDHDEKALARKFLKVDPVRDTRLRRIMTENSPGPLAKGTPVFLAQGTADDLVRPHITKDYMAGLCRSGTPVTLHLIDGGGHMWAGRDSAYAAVAWMRQRFAGTEPRDSCRGDDDRRGGDDR